MKKFLSFVLAAIMLMMCLFAVSCNKEDDGNGSDTVAQTEPQGPAVTRCFVAGYEQAAGEQIAKLSGRVLMNLWNDGKMDIYVGTSDDNGYKTAHYTGTYSFGENAEFDETISFTYSYGEGQSATVTDEVILDGIFETPFYIGSAMTAGDVKFYETAPASTDGDVYVGYLTKSGGMGSMVYAYALCMRDDGTFDVSIMQLARVMHVWGLSEGTYVADGDKLTFTYDVSDGEGGIAKEDYTTTGTDYTENSLMVGFNIAQTSVSASPASFIRVK
jgi:hypothetical protein